MQISKLTPGTSKTLVPSACHAVEVEYKHAVEVLLRQPHECLLSGCPCSGCPCSTACQATCTDYNKNLEGMQPYPCPSGTIPNPNNALYSPPANNKCCLPTCVDRNVVSSGIQPWACPAGTVPNNALVNPPSNRACCNVSDMFRVLLSSFPVAAAAAATWRDRHLGAVHHMHGYIQIGWKRERQWA